jgi:hypothetical protein
MTLTILALALVVLTVLLSLGCVMLLVSTTSRNQMSMALRMTQAAETAITQSGETAGMAFAEANQAGMLTMTKAIALVEAAGIQAATSIENSSRRAQEAVDLAGLRTTEVVADAQRTIRLMSSQLFPSASPAPPSGSPPEQDGVQTVDPWDIQFGAEVREQSPDVQWPPPPMPGMVRDGKWIVAPDSQQPGWDAAPAPPPMQPPVENEDELSMARFQYEQARQVDPNPDG